MMKYITPGTVAGILSFLGTITIAFKMPALGAFLSDPVTATTVTAVVSGVIALGAGVMAGLKPPAA